VSALMDIGKQLLGRRHVYPSVVGSLQELQVEGTFPDGTYLVTIHHPICTENGDLNKALYGSFLPVPSQDLFPLHDEGVWAAERQPGAVVAVKGRCTLNPGRKCKQLKVTNKGDRPIQVRCIQIPLVEQWLICMWYRSAPTITSLKPTPSLNSTARKPTVTA